MNEEKNTKAITNEIAPVMRPPAIALPFNFPPLMSAMITYIRFVLVADKEGER